ncbi:MAG TPA: hypothetical protein VNM14_21905 [Planctomycetota bacterium]|nr:hypothetical protein [Planctomycetota bacterium]
MSGAQLPVPELPAWIWPISTPLKVREWAWSLSSLADPCVRGTRGIGAAIAVGVVPLALSRAFGVPGQQAVSAAALLLLCLACVRRNEASKGIAFLLLAFLSHCVMALAIAESDPELAARIMPGAQAYWERQRAWVWTGWDLEYEPAVWIPAHVGQVGGAVLYSYVSLGWFTFFEGFREVDWMNFYSARLLDCSRNPLTALLLGWHVWSIVRGLGFAVLSFEVLSLSLARLTGRDLSCRRDRAWRWSAGLGLFLADALLKFFLLHSVQQSLHDNLR